MEPRAMTNREITAIGGLIVGIAIVAFALGAAAWEWVQPILKGWLGW